MTPAASTKACAHRWHRSILDRSSQCNHPHGVGSGIGTATTLHDLDQQLFNKIIAYVAGSPKSIDTIIAHPYSLSFAQTCICRLCIGEAGKDLQHTWRVYTLAVSRF